MIIWQDMVIAIANLLIIISLFSQVYYGFINKKGYIILRTSFITLISLYAMSIAFFYLSLFLSFLFTFMNATLWLILFIQRIIYTKV